MQEHQQYCVEWFMSSVTAVHERKFPALHEHSSRVVGRDSLAGVALDQADFITVHALERHQLCSEVVPVDGLLGAVADRAGQETVATAHLTRAARVRALQHNHTLVVVLHFVNYILRIKRRQAIFTLSCRSLQ